MKNELQQLILSALDQEFGVAIDAAQVHIERPNDPTHGDWATNVALSMAKELKAPPRQIAEKVVANPLFANLDLVSSVSVAGPGFINFVLNDEYYWEVLSSDIDTSHPKYVGQKYMVEFTDPNPFKELHIGHLYQNTIGEAISRILTAAGAEVKRADYFGDVGMHVAKSIWGLITKLEKENIDFAELETQDLKARMKLLGQAYALGATAYTDDTRAAEEMKGINKQIFIAAQKFYTDKYGKQPNIDYGKIEVETKYPQEYISELYHKGRAWSLAYFDSIYARLGVKFDYYYPESIAAEFGYEMVQKGLKEGIFSESNGAIVFDEQVNKLHTRVFINSLGLPTYEGKELGLPYIKKQDYDYDRAVIIVGDEIEAYFRVLLKAIEMLDPSIREITEAKFNGMVKLPEGKMSSRTGKIVRAEDFLNDIVAKLQEVTAEQERELDNEELETIAQAAIKYGFLKFVIEGDKEFNSKQAISFEGNTGPYLLYTYVRAHSILDRLNYQPTKNELPKNMSGLERELAVKIDEYPDVVFAAAETRAPNLVATYLYDLAKLFNKFYGEHHIVDANKVDQELWLALTHKTAAVVKHGLDLLGIGSVDRM